MGRGTYGLIIIKDRHWRMCGDEGVCERNLCGAEGCMGFGAATGDVVLHLQAQHTNKTQPAIMTVIECQVVT